MSRGQLGDEAALQADAELQQRRRALHAPRQLNYTLYVHTTEASTDPTRPAGGEGRGAGLCCDERVSVCRWSGCRSR